MRYIRVALIKHVRRRRDEAPHVRPGRDEEVRRVPHLLRHPPRYRARLQERPQRVRLLQEQAGCERQLPTGNLS